MKKSIIFSILLALVFTACIGGGNTKEEWTSLIYPDKANSKRSKKNGIYKTLEECKKASKAELDRLGLSQRGFYQCGLNCSFNEGAKMDICEKLSK
jgi:hypothetical protein